ncbi:MAG: hypothetical protein AB7E34_04385 [Acidaminococcaceae bacterium]
MIKSICRLSIVLIALFHLAKVFFSLAFWPLTLSTAALFIFGLAMQGQGFRKITLFFAIMGSAILFYYKMPLKIWEQTLISMTNIIAIIVVMQLFTIPIEIGKYSNTIEYWLKRSFKKESSLYLFIMLVTTIFSSFLMFGTIPVMVSLFNNALKNNIADCKRFLATAILRGYALVIFWSPGAVVMLLVMEVINVDWFELFVPGLLLSLIGLGTAYFLEHFTHLNKTIAAKSITQTGEVDDKLANKQSVHIMMVVLCFLALVAVFEHFSIGSGTGKILLSGFIIAVLWISYYCEDKQLKNTMSSYWENGITKANDFSVFFIAMGLFAGSVDDSGILNQLQPILQNGVSQLGLLSVGIIPILFIILSLFGIHPLILIVLFAKILLTLSLPLPLVSIGLILILSASISFIITPFAGMAIMTANFLNAKPIDVSIKWNIIYSTLFLAEGIIFVILWSRIL